MVERHRVRRRRRRRGIRRLIVLVVHHVEMFAREIADVFPAQNVEPALVHDGGGERGISANRPHLAGGESPRARAIRRRRRVVRRTGRPTATNGAVRSRACTRRRLTSGSGGLPMTRRRAASSAAFVPASPLPSTPAASSSQPSVRAGAGARIRDGPRVSDPGVGFKIASGSERVVSTSPASARARATTPGSRSRNRASSRTRNARSSAARASARVSASASPSAPSAPLSVARNAAPSMESVRVTSRAVTVAARV